MSIFSLISIFIEFHSLGLLFYRIHVLVIQRKKCKTLVNATFYLLFVHTTCWMKVFSHFISICFFSKFRENFYFYILQPCSGQTSSFSFKLKASAVFYSLIYFNIDLILCKNFKFELFNYFNRLYSFW